MSKAYLSGEANGESLLLRPQEVYEAAGITVRLGVRLASIDREHRIARFSDGSEVAYGKLALCTGGRARPWDCKGMDPAAPPTTLHYLRTQADADRIRAGLRPGARLLVVGGGYIGLAIAASATKLGPQVTLLEAQPRVLSRAAGENLSAFYEDVHRNAGVELRTAVAIESVECMEGAIRWVRCEDGQAFEADLVVAGVGMLPNTEVAAAAGIADADGILVDELSRTRDPHIVAAGGCTVHDSALYGRRIRLESVPNALERARAAASWLCGKPKPNRAVPWFWSDQYDLKLQIVGLSPGFERCVVRGDMVGRSFCAFYVGAGRLLAADAVNRPAEFMVVKRALGAQVAVDVEALRDESRPLKELLLSTPGKP